MHISFVMKNLKKDLMKLKNSKSKPQIINKIKIRQRISENSYIEKCQNAKPYSAGVFSENCWNFMPKMQ
jgi:hypothetical protein